MTELPPGWEWSTLEGVQAAEDRAMTDGPFGSNLKSSHYTADGARIVRLQNIGDGVFVDGRAYISLEHFQKLRAHEVIAGDLVVSSLGDELPRACIVPDLKNPAIVKADCIRVRLHPTLDRKWILYALIAPQTRRYAKSRIRGVGRPRLGLNEIRKLPLPVPPLAEQRRIVATLEDHLSRLEAGKSQLELVMRRIETLRDRMIDDACTGVGMHWAGQSTAEPPAPAGVVDGALPKLPKSWQWRRLGSFAEVVGGVAKDAKKQSDPSLPEVPYLRVANVQRGKLDLGQIARIRVRPEKVKALELQPGDVLMNEGGDRDKLGRGWVWDGQIDGCIHQNHVFRARIRDGVMEPKLLAWYANGVARHWFEVNGKQSVNLASISLSKIKLLPVPVPPPAQQAEIVSAIEAKVSSLDEAKAMAISAVDKAGALRRALLDEAFAGRLVAQDPGDEPAAVLLERIRAERAAAPRQRRGRRPGKKAMAPPVGGAVPVGVATQEELPL